MKAIHAATFLSPPFKTLVTTLSLTSRAIISGTMTLISLISSLAILLMTPAPTLTVRESPVLFGGT